MGKEYKKENSVTAVAVGGVVYSYTSTFMSCDTCVAFFLRFLEKNPSKTGHP